MLCGFVTKLLGKSAREARVYFEIGRSAEHWGGRGGIWGVAYVKGLLGRPGSIQEGRVGGPRRPGVERQGGVGAWVRGWGTSGRRATLTRAWVAWDGPWGHGLGWAWGFCREYG